MEPREMASLMLGLNRAMLAEVVESNGAETVAAILRAMADIIERGAFERETMH